MGSRRGELINIVLNVQMVFLAELQLTRVRACCFFLFLSLAAVRVRGSLAPVALYPVISMSMAQWLEMRVDGLRQAKLL
jgi:hypothetical protein